MGHSLGESAIPSPTWPPEDELARAQQLDENDLADRIVSAVYSPAEQGDAQQAALAIGNLLNFGRINPEKIPSEHQRAAGVRAALLYELGRRLVDRHTWPKKGIED